MSALLGATWLLFHVHLPRLLRARRTLFVLLLALAPAALAWIVTSLSGRIAPGEVAANGGWIMLVQVVTPLSALVLGAATVAEEVEDRTITYLFTRPMPRAALLLGRWAAIALILVLILGLATWLFLLAAERARGDGPPVDAQIARALLFAVLAGAVTYSALAAALGAFVRHPILIGLGYAFAVEGFLANLPGRNQSLTVQHHLRSLMAAQGSPLWAKVEGFASASYESGGTALVVLACIALGALALGSWRLARREFVLSE